MQYSTSIEIVASINLKSSNYAGIRRETADDYLNN